MRSTQPQDVPLVGKPAGGAGIEVEGAQGAPGDQLSQREFCQAGFLRALFHSLEEHGVRYCVLHGWEALPEKLRGDLDLAVHPADRLKLPPVIRALREGGYRTVQLVDYAVKSHRLDFAWLAASGMKSVAVDIVFQYREDRLLVASGEALVAGRYRQKNFWVAAPGIEFAYLLAKKSLKGNLPPHQAHRLKHLSRGLRRPEATRIAGKLFGEQWKSRVVEACTRDFLRPLLPKLKRRLWVTALMHEPLDQIRGLSAEALRLLKRWLQPIGHFLVILGPDGVGKSTVALRLTEVFQPVFRRSRVFHWRPNLIARRKETGVPVTDPHAQLPHGTLGSSMRLLVVFLDYWVCYLVVIRPSLVRNGLVVFDRYFHDLLVDPRRYRYGGPLWLARLLSRLIPRPDMVLVLDASEDVLLSRKQEVAPREVRRQRSAYLECSREFPASCILDASRPSPEVSTAAVWAVVQQLEQRVEARHSFWFRPMQEIAEEKGTAPGTLQIWSLGSLRSALAGFFEPSPRRPWAALQEPPRTAKEGGAVMSLGRARNDGQHLSPAIGNGRMHSFVLLPSRKSPRLLLPLEDSGAMLKGLEIYTPYAWAARLSKRLLTRAIKTGWHGWGRHRVMIPSGAPFPLESLVRDITGEPQLSFSISVGTPGRYRKLTVQAMRPGGEILGYLKLPLTPHATERVRHEAEMLNRLANFPTLRPHIPAVLYSGEWEDGYLLFQASGPSCAGPVEFSPLHQEFLQNLWSVRPLERPGSALVEEIADNWQQTKPLMDAELYVLGERALDEAREKLSGESVKCGVGHGDFAPWNTRLGDGPLFLFDWESAAWDAPNLWDIFHFEVQVRGLLKSGNGRGLPFVRDRAQKASFLLYLLGSVCRSFEEGAAWDHAGVQYRKRLLQGVLTCGR